MRQGIGGGLEGVVPTLELTRRPPAGPVVRLAAVGDVTASGRVAPHLAGGRGGPRWDVFRDLQAADLAFANLECVARGEGAARPFSVNEATLASLCGEGFDVFNLANNHVMDRGADGLEATIAVVEAAGAAVIGVAQNATEDIAPIRTDRRGLRIGWLAAARTLGGQPKLGPRIWDFDGAILESAVQRARERLDVLIVSLHAGFMLVEYPAPELRAVALRLTAAGADLILMHHPHVLQGVEVTAGHRVICYSLGNFLFDWREGEIRVPIVEHLQRQGGIFSFELDRKGVASAVFVPTILDDDCRVVRPTPALAAEICDRVARLSRELAEDYVPRFERQRAERNTTLGVKTLLRLLCKGRIVTLFEHLRRLRPHHFVMAWRWFVGESS